MEFQTPVSPGVMLQGRKDPLVSFPKVTEVEASRAVGKLKDCFARSCVLSKSGHKFSNLLGSCV